MQVHLFISHFKQDKKRNYKYFIEIAALVIFLVLGKQLLEYMLINDAGTFERILMNDFYTNEENIDNLYLGTSHVFCDLNPEILDDINGENNFNLATSAQPLIASYYLLKEADKMNSLSHVYLDLNYSFVIASDETSGDMKQLNMMVTSWQVLNQMKFSKNKLQWILESTEPRYLYLSMFPPLQYKKDLLNFDYLGDQLYNKAQVDYLTYNDYASYTHKGYAHGEHMVTEPYCATKYRSTLRNLRISEQAKEYLVKIIDYCNENDILLTLYASPVTDYILCVSGEYDDFVKQMKEFAASYGLEYYDFNLCKKEYLDIGDNHYWSDNNHMNAFGAEVYTNAFGNFFKNISNGEIQSEFFYESYQQKLDDIDEQIFGVVIEEINDEKFAEYSYLLNGIDSAEWRVFLLSTVDNLRNDKAEFYVYQIDQDTGEAICVQDWSDNNMYVFPQNIETGQIYAKVRMSETKQEYGEVSINY